MTNEANMQLEDLQQRFDTRYREWATLHEAFVEAAANNDRVTKQLHGLSWVAHRFYGDELRSVLLREGLAVPEDIGAALLRSATAGAAPDNPNAPFGFTALRTDYHRIHEQQSLARTAEEEARQLVVEAETDLDGLQALAHGFHGVHLTQPRPALRVA